MKLNKATLKNIIIECVYEVLEDDPSILMPIIKENLRGLMKQKTRVKQQLTNESRHPDRPRISQAIQSSNAGRSQDEPVAIWDQLALDTLKTTYREQAADRPRDRMLVEADESQNYEEGPWTHLARAQSMPAQHRASQHVDQRPMQQSITQTYDSDESAPSLASLQAKFANENRHRGGDDILPAVPDDLSMLGDMSNFVDLMDQPSRGPSLKVR